MDLHVRRAIGELRLAENLKLMLMRVGGVVGAPFRWRAYGLVLADVAHVLSRGACLFRRGRVLFSVCCLTRIFNLKT